MEHAWASLAEDLGPGDLSAACVPADAQVKWVIEAQADGILAGCGIAHFLLSPDADDPEPCYADLAMADGQAVKSGDVVLEGVSLAYRLLSRERTALNYLMHLSGVASLTSRYVREVADTSARIVDTRKTTPGMRTLEKYAVRCGGGHNHRMGLYDGIMVKDNHIAIAGSIAEAVNRARQRAGHMTKIEVECESLEMVRQAVEAGADVVMLDNMDPFSMQQVVKAFKGRTLLEASGGITLETVRGVAGTGVDLISVGALTHSAPALAFHLEVA